jgi:CRISPR-associated protein Cas5t
VRLTSYPKEPSRIFSEFLFYIYTGRSLYELLAIFAVRIYQERTVIKIYKEEPLKSKNCAGWKKYEIHKSKFAFLYKLSGGVKHERSREDYIKRAFWAGRELKSLLQ